VTDSAAPAWRQPPIADYGFLSDCHSAALVSRDGSVDWWCLPRFDSASVFGRLLDPDAGCWSIRPVEDFGSQRHYIGDSLVLRTVFRTAAGEIEVTDALAVEHGTRGHDLGLRSPHVLLRTVSGLSGVVDVQSTLVPRMEYGRTQPNLRQVTGGVEARGGPVRLVLTAPVPMRAENGAATATFAVTAGHSVQFRLVYSPAFGFTPTLDQEAPTIEDTLAAWESWTALHTDYDGRYPADVRRSSLVLQGLTYQPSGAIIAAATTSLPEQMG
jgi:GH15 family glucan-1,4-alpha-glucosidase